MRAGRRLADPQCSAVLGDFHDTNGQSLAAHLAATSLTPTEFLSELWWIDGSDRVECLRNTMPVAFTTPGRRAIFVCGSRFLDQSLLRGEQGEMIVIHEMLHALGLGENPPTSEEITARVRARCGDW
jgi:hypothetical protein